MTGPFAHHAPLNLVLVTLDTTRADALGAYGQKLPITPNLDRLAAEGVLFEQVMASNPNTLASHTTLFTGLHPFAHGVRSNQGYRVPREQVTLAERLAARGYRTGAEIGAAVLRRETRIAQGFEHVRDTDSPGVVYEEPTKVRGGQTAPRLVRTGADVTEGGLRFLRERGRSPFFLWLHYYGPHDPYSAPEPFRSRYPNNPYLAEVAAVDAEVGRVVDALERRGLRERTLVVVMADHGEGLREHGERTHTFFVYESTMRVPLIFWGPPSLPRGRRVASVAAAVDLVPTILDWLGLPPADGLHGQSLRAFAEGREDAERVAYGEAIDLYRILGTTPLRALRQGHWKYIHKVGPELYDLDADPDEQTNLATRHPERVRSLRAQLEALLSRSPAGDASVELDAQTQSQLEALGYLAPATGSPLPDELALLEWVGADPATFTDDLLAMSRAKGRLQSRRFHAALHLLEPLVERHPDSATLQAMTGSALAGVRRHADALEHFEKALALDPDSAENVERYVRALVSGGATTRAGHELARFVSRHPCSGLRARLVRMLHGQERYREQIAVLEEGERVCPDSEGNLNDYAWALATSPDDSLRDGDRAVELAQRAIDLSEGAASPNLLDTLAAAYAEAGDLDAAVEAQQSAIEILEREGAVADRIQRFRRKLADYEARAD